MGVDLAAFVINLKFKCIFDSPDSMQTQKLHQPPERQVLPRLDCQSNQHLHAQKIPVSSGEQN